MKPLLVVAIPSRGTIIAETHHCLRNMMDGYPTYEEIVARRDVIEARNELARRIRSLPSMLPADANLSEFVLWIDDDAWWPAGCVAKAVDILETHDEIAMICGYFTSRAPYKGPMAARLDRRGWSRSDDVELVEVARCGFHWVLMRRAVLTAIPDARPFDLLDRGEDHAFCDRVRAAGLRIFCATNIPIYHVQGALVFFPLLPTLRMRDLWSVDYDVDFAAAKREYEQMRAAPFGAFLPSYEARNYSREVDRRCREYWSGVESHLSEGRAVTRKFEEAKEAARRGDPSARRKLAAALRAARGSAISKQAKKLREAGWNVDGGAAI